ncbi:MAG: response regulator [Nitrosomonadales bacterium]|nr:response regulator [Nitrosomonadales bacterium]
MSDNLHEDDLMGTPATKPKSFSHELTVALAVSITLVAALFGTLTFLYNQHNQTGQFAEGAARYEDNLQWLLEPALWNVDDDLVMRIGIALTTTGNFSSLTIRDEQQRDLYRYGEPGLEKDTHKIDIRHDGAVIGSAEFRLNLQPYEDERRRILYTTVGFALLLVTLLFLSLRWTINKVLRRPMGVLNAAIHEVVEGKSPRIPPENTYEEFSTIVDSINTMSMAVAEREGSLRASEQKLLTILDNLDAYVYLKDTEGRYLFANRKVRELWHADMDGIVGSGDDKFFDSSTANNIRRNDLRVLEQGATVRELETNTVTDTGVTRVFQSTKLPLRNESGGIYALCGISVDITERIQTEQELNRYKDHLEEEVESRTAELVLARDAAETANKAKSVFLASMSHELRTPLNAILGFSSLMLKDSGRREVQRTHLEIIHRSGEHLLTLINDVLEMAKIEAGKVQLEKAPFDLGALVREVTDMMQIRAEGKGLRLLLDQSSSFPRFINGDEARLRQILLNLLSNAVKFTEQGGVTLRLGSRMNGGLHLLIEVEDSGPGISAEDQKRLFQPFVQFGKQPGDNQGTGLGLSITRQFVQLMGGTISVESTPGKGSIFRVVLPAETTSSTEVAGTQNGTEDTVLGLAPGQPEYRILIVEDQTENQLLLRRLLERVGLQSEVADDGKQAVGMFQRWQPHLILMDRRMPVMDGIEATKAIRALPGGQEVKIVAVTASAFKEQQTEMLAAGMDDFVRKPYRFNEIYDCLSRQLGVQFIHEEAHEDGAAPSMALTAEMMAVLPPALRNELKVALQSLDSDRIAAAIARVADHDTTLCRALSRIVENFDYPVILNAIENTHGK